MRAWVSRDKHGQRRLWLWEYEPTPAIRECRATACASRDLKDDQFANIQPAPGECVEVELTAREVQP